MQTSLSFENTMSGLEIDDWSILLAHKRGLTQTPKHKQKFVFGCLCQILFFHFQDKKKVMFLFRKKKRLRVIGFFRGRHAVKRNRKNQQNFFPVSLPIQKKKQSAIQTTFRILCMNVNNKQSNYTANNNFQFSFSLYSQVFAKVAGAMFF